MAEGSPRRPGLQSSESDFLQQHGYLCLRNFYPRPLLARLRQQIGDQVRKVTTRQLQAMPPFQQISRLSTQVKIPGLHEALVTPQLAAKVAAIAGGAKVSVQATQLLLSLPRQGTWTLDGLNWHVDVAAQPRGPLPGIQAFALIDDVVPRGGATLALAGSHGEEVLRPAGRVPLRELLRTSENLGADLREADVEVVEMSGRAGDLYLMDMRVLHTPSINASDHVRMMATARFFIGT